MTDDEATIGLELHARLMAGDPIAPSDLCRRYLLRLNRQLAAKFPTTDSDLVNDAVEDALINYTLRPEQYDPTRGKTLVSYLFMAARGDLLNAIERHRPRWEHEKPLEPVEIEAAGGKSKVAAGVDVGDEIVDEEAARHVATWAMSITKTEEERTVMRLILDGERSTEAFARELGLDSLSRADQQRRVFAIKDRLTKRLRRARGAADG